MRRISTLLPSPSMAVALLALFVALGGSAYAVKAAKAPKNSVVTKSIRKGAVKPAKIAAGAVRTAKIARGAVKRGKIAPGAVGAAQLGEGAVGAAQLGDGAVTGAKVGANTITANNIDLPTLGIPKPTTFTVRSLRLARYISPESSVEQAFRCEPGETIVGGGGRGGYDLTESYPFVEATRQGWDVVFRNPTTESEFTNLVVYAICASAP